MKSLILCNVCLGRSRSLWCLWRRLMCCWYRSSSCSAKEWYVSSKWSLNSSHHILFYIVIIFPNL